ncbi:ABC-type transporter, integral membrane subunit [Marinithermus hydrothermalis DSM 14884]|uniref:ABC-type transporter, integral membrane subunit n=1 Tax=Marinithermus hydrothermalis (strain DSM 14884 / JCM 11576 / T1) TaxID=869210 RepID=F2NLE1_MARHT|nr:branched-chain amino acid ABC transporter permease [Marinithermus hydrothermalis]AEB11760.1 ABC-type transporter, integral membrane subunit [Marinithermus hydrothermalis DSM 14884]
MAAPKPSPVPKTRSGQITLLVGIVLALLLAWRVISLENYTLARGVQDFFNALTLGSLYALIALGYTMVYGIIRLINFAHGEIFMLGAFFAFYAMLFTPLPWAVALLVTVLVGGVVLGVLRAVLSASSGSRQIILGAVIFIGSFLLLTFRAVGWVEALLISMLLTAVAGVLLEAIAYRPLRGAPRESMLITAIAASFFLQNVGQLIFGPRIQGFTVETSLNQVLTLNIGGDTVYFTGILLLVPAITAVLLFILNRFITQSRLGKAMRATAQDAEVAQMMGVNVNQIISLTFLIGATLAAAAGVMYALRFGQVHPLMGLLPGIKAFTAAVIGGIGSLPGAVLGGLVLGFIEIYVVSLFPALTAYRDVFAFVLLILILLFRPSGLIGEDLTEKV